MASIVYRLFMFFVVVVVVVVVVLRLSAVVRGVRWCAVGGGCSLPFHLLGICRSLLPRRCNSLLLFVRWFGVGCWWLVAGGARPSVMLTKIPVAKSRHTIRKAWVPHENVPMDPNND